MKRKLFFGVYQTLLILLYFVLATIFLFSSAIYGAPLDLSNNFERQDPGHIAFVHYIDGDSTDEICFILDYENTILIYSLLKGTSCHIPINDNCTILNVKCANLLSAPDDELIVSIKELHGFKFYIYKDILRKYENQAPVDSVNFVFKDSIFFDFWKDGSPPEDWSAEGNKFEFVESRDLNHDNYPDLIFIINAGWQKYPRKIFAYDIINKQIIWQYNSANQLLWVGCADLDNDGSPEIAISGRGPHNDAKNDLDTDDRSRLMLLDIAGNELWKKEFNKDSRDCYADIAIEGPNNPAKLYALVNYIYGAKPDAGQVEESEFYCIDAASKEVLYHTTVNSPGSPICCYKVNNSKSPEVVASFQDGSFKIFRSNLELKGEKKTNCPIPFFSVSDLNKDNYPEFLLVTSDQKAIVVDYDLRDIGIYANQSFLYSKSQMYMATTTSSNFKGLGETNKSSKIFIDGVDKSGISSARRFSAPFIPPRRWYAPFYVFAINRRNTIITSILLCLLLFGTMYFGLRFKKIDSIYKAIWASGEFGIIKFSGGKLVNINSTAEALLKFKHVKAKVYTLSSFLNTANMQELEKKFEESDIASICRPIRMQINNSSTSIELEARIIIIKLMQGRPKDYIIVICEPEFIKKDWLALARGIAHDIKNPSGLASTQLANIAAEIREGEILNSTELIDRIDSANANIKRSIERVSMFATTVKELNIKPEITDINKYLKEYSLIRKVSLPNNIALKYEPGLALPNALIDTHYFTSVLDNLFDNAIDAIPAEKPGIIAIFSGVDNISSNTDQGDKLKECVSISISDTGSGIPEHDLHLVFNLEFSTKKSKGLGMGLYQVKRIIEGHGGKIEVRSYKNEGTTFTVYIPIGKK